ncbi:MAG TPA: phage tail protein [Trichormus sp. M33_DOE_039]|nr:phage tail protein [Trichormus sp. M33_DOE_039]
MAEFPEILTNSRFYLELKLTGSQEPIDGYFMECQGFKTTQEVIEISEVTPLTWGKTGNANGRIVRSKIPGSITYSNIVLRRGLTISMTMWNWLASVKEGKWGDERRDGSLVIYNQAAEEKFRLEFKNAWPSSYTISDVKADGSEHQIEEIEMVVEELKRVAVA